jgi:hypothetical protein
VPSLVAAVISYVVDADVDTDVDVDTDGDIDDDAAATAVGEAEIADVSLGESDGSCGADNDAEIVEDFCGRIGCGDTEIDIGGVGSGGHASAKHN